MCRFDWKPLHGSSANARPDCFSMFRCHIMQLRGWSKFRPEELGIFLGWPAGLTSADRCLLCCAVLCYVVCTGVGEQEQMAAELERSKASVARLLKERDDLEDKLKALGKELRQAINEKSVQVGERCQECEHLVCKGRHIMQA